MRLDEATLRKALNRAFDLGETHWQQADSESYSQNRKADQTRRTFEAHVETHVKALAQEMRCQHVWKVTSQRLQGLWSRCELCGARKEETWD